jgi:hypothetical protein
MRAACSYESEFFLYTPDVAEVLVEAFSLAQVTVTDAPVKSIEATIAIARRLRMMVAPYVLNEVYTSFSKFYYYSL